MMSQGPRTGNAKVPTVNLEEWTQRMDKVPICRTQLNELVMGWLAIEGFKDAAAVFQQEACVQIPMPLETLETRVAVREAIHKGDMAAALSAVNSMDPNIAETQPNVMFTLKIQHLIEIIRGGDITMAMDFARIEIAPLVEGNPSFLPRLERAISLLAFERVEDCPSAEVLSTAHRQHTAAVVNAALLQAHGLEPTSQLESMVKLMIWAQGRLDERVIFPHLNVMTGQLTSPE